jgi:hypothetical protein
VNYKRLACYEHCPGTFGYTFVYIAAASSNTASLVSWTHIPLIAVVELCHYRIQWAIFELL